MFSFLSKQFLLLDKNLDSSNMFAPFSKKERQGLDACIY